MEIEINSKKNNPLFNRTEVHFTIQHEGEGTPNREIIRSELAEKLNAKKENIIIKSINSSFGIQQSTGYAKIYDSTKYSENLERKYILNRNKVTGKKQKDKEDKKEIEDKSEQKQEDSIKEEDKKDMDTKTEEPEKTKEESKKIEEKKE